MKKLVILLIAVLASSPAVAQSSQSVQKPHYNFKPGTELHYRIVEEKLIDDPDKVSNYTNEFTDSTEATLRVDSVRPDGSGILSLKFTKQVHRDKSKHPVGEESVSISWGTYPNSARIVCDPLGNLIDSAVTEFTEEQARLVKGKGPKHIASEANWELRKIHTDFVARIPHPKSGNTNVWSDTVKKLVYVATMDAGGVAPSGQPDNGQRGQVLITNFSISNEKSETRIDVSSTDAITGNETVTTASSDRFRQSDGALVSRTSEKREPEIWKGHHYTYITRKTIRLME